MPAVGADGLPIHSLPGREGFSPCHFSFQKRRRVGLGGGGDTVKIRQIRTRTQVPDQHNTQDW